MLVMDGRVTRTKLSILHSRFLNTEYTKRHLSGSTAHGYQAREAGVVRFGTLEELPELARQVSERRRKLGQLQPL
jgi:hypothetical protein